MKSKALLENNVSQDRMSGMGSVISGGKEVGGTGYYN